MTLVLGIDPGSRHTGFGLIRQSGSQLQLVASGTIHTLDDDFPCRLGEIFTRLDELMQEFTPDEVAIEKVFMAKNADSALKLGQARGAAISAVVRYQKPLFEYSARQVKQALVGIGSAEKKQVAHMVGQLLKHPDPMQADAADACAIAICHAHMRTSLIRMAGATAVRRRRIR